MNCKKCGSQLRENAKFCDKCGEKVEKITTNENENFVSNSISEGQIESYNEKVVSNIENKEDNSIDNDSKTASENYEESKIYTPFYKKKWFLFALVIIIIAIIIIIIKFGTNNSTKSDTTNNNTNITTQLKTDNSDNVQYIGERSVDYEEETKQFRVFFSLSDSNENQIDASGTATINIQNDNGESVYSKDITFTKDDFSSWTNAYRDDGNYMACLYIPITDISTGTIESGILSLEVELSDGRYFDKKEIKISSNLPLKGITISLPSVPNTYKQYNYKNELKYEVQVKELSYKLGNCYDGKQSVTISLKVEMLAGCANTAASSQIGYSLIDSNGIVVDSGTIFNTSLFNGETTVTEKTIMNLKVGENYTLKLNNAK